MEIFQFIYCPLSRIRVLSVLTHWVECRLNDWAAYMDSSKIEPFSKIDTADILLNHEIGEELQRGTTGDLQESRNRCREFMDRLVDVLLGCNLVVSDFLQGVYAFCPELLLEGDDRYFRLFSWIQNGVFLHAVYYGMCSACYRWSQHFFDLGFWFWSLELSVCEWSFCFHSTSFAFIRSSFGSEERRVVSAFPGCQSACENWWF